MRRPRFGSRLSWVRIVSATAFGDYDDRVDASRRHGLPSRLLRLASDERLVELLRERGSEAAFEALYTRHHRGVLSFCRHMVGSVEEAEDALQHTFLAAYRDIVGSRKQIQVRPWLYAIARNRCITVLRARREQAGAMVVEPSTELLSVEVERRHDLRALLGDLAGLPDDQRAALVLAELGDMSHEEIGQALDCPREKVKALVFQARSSLISSREARDASCTEIREQLANLRGGALRRNLLRRHLRECAGCRDFRDNVTEQRRELALILPVAPSLGLQAAVLGAAGGAATSSVVAKTAIVLVVAGGGMAAVEETRRHDGGPSTRDAAVVRQASGDPNARVAGASAVAAPIAVAFGRHADRPAIFDTDIFGGERASALDRSGARGRDARGRRGAARGSEAAVSGSPQGLAVGRSGGTAPGLEQGRAVGRPEDRGTSPGVGRAHARGKTRERSDNRDVAPGQTGDRGNSGDRSTAPQAAAPKAPPPPAEVTEPAPAPPPEVQAPVEQTAPQPAEKAPAPHAAALEKAADGVAKAKE